MTDPLRRGRDAVRRASDRVDDETVREQLRSIDAGLEGLTAEAGDDRHVGDQLEAVEQKLAGLLDETDGPAREDIRAARDAIDEYRQTRTRDW